MSLIACKQTNGHGYMIIGGNVRTIDCFHCWHEDGKPCGYWFIEINGILYTRPDTYYFNSPYDWELVK